MPGLNLISTEVETLNQQGARKHIHCTISKLVPGLCGTESLRDEKAISLRYRYVETSRRLQVATIGVDPVFRTCNFLQMALHL